MAHRRSSTAAVVVLALALAGVGVAGYLWYSYQSGGEPICFGLSSCGSVQTSSYTYLLGLPVAAWGFAAYVAIAAATAGRLMAPATGRLEAALRLGVFGMSLTGALFSVYLQFISVFVIGSVCVWCAISALLMVTIFVLSTRQV